MGRALVASLALVLGCKAGAGPTTPSAPARLASRSTEERAQPHAAAAKQPVLAVISIGDPLGWMSEIDAHILPPHLRGGADEQAIRGILSRALGGTTPMGDKVDLGSPIGCAVGDPRSKEPLACVFGYAGGSDAFVVDAGGSPGDEAMTALNMRSQRVYVAPLRERVVVSTDRDLLAASHTALGMLPTERTKHPHDVEAVVYPSAVLDAFADRLDAVVARVITKQVDAAGDDPLAAALIRARVAQGVAMAAGFSEVEEAALWLDVAADRSAIGYRGRAAPGTATATTYAVAHETGPIDPTTLGRMPDEAMFLVAFALDFERIESHYVFGGVVTVLTDFGDRIKARTGPSVRALFDVLARVTDGRGAFAALDVRETPLATVIALRRTPGVDAVAALREYLHGEHARALLEPLREHIDMRLSPRAGKVAGVPFDAITFSRVAGSSWFATDERYLGSPPQLRVLLAQTADTLYVVAARDHEKQVLARVLRAARGKRAIENEPHAKTYLATHARDQFVVLTDVVRLLEWERRLGVPGLPKPVRGEGGRNSVAFSSRPVSETEHEYVLAMSQRMIDVFRGL